jgi:hypothetical protein
LVRGRRFGRFTGGDYHSTRRRKNYGSLIKGGHDELSTIPLGNQSAVQAVETLSSYNLHTTPKLQLEQAMLKFMIMVSEATRFKVIREEFNGPRWVKETYLTKQQSKYVVVWGSLSRLLVEWKRSKNIEWPRQNKNLVDTGVKGAPDALNLLDFLLRPALN